MYQVCRHIKPSGQRCKSPAMRDHSFCYFHARVHKRSKLIDPRELRFPVPEDFAAIQESIAKVLDGIVEGSIAPKQSSQILRGLQIAMQTIPRTPAPQTELVQEVTLSKKGDELAPPLEICPPELEAGSSQKALPSHTGFDPVETAGNVAKPESGHGEILCSLESRQLLIGGEKALHYLDNPNHPH